MFPGTKTPREGASRLKMAFLAALWLITSPLGAQEAPPGQSESFFKKDLGACGMVTRYSSTEIPEGCLTEALNVYMDEDLGIVRRQGFAQFNTAALANSQAVRGIWHFRANDGTDYMVVLSSETMYQSSGGAFTAITGLNGFSRTSEMDCTQALGNLWCANGVQSLFSWTGSATAAYSGAPLGPLIDNYRNRILIANVVSNQSRLYLSGELDGTDWTIPSSPVSTSPAIIAIGGVNDGNRIECLVGTHQDIYIIGKRESTHGLYGFDRRDFAVRELSREVGCIENKSAGEKQGALYWLSKRGLEKLFGPSLARVSDPIRDLVDTIILAGGNTRSATDTLQADFELGNLTASGPGAAISATLSPGNIIPSSFSVLATNSGDFTNWTLNNFIVSSTNGISLNGGCAPAGATSSGTATSPAFDTQISSPYIRALYEMYDGIAVTEFSSMTVQYSSTGLSGPWTDVVVLSTYTSGNTQNYNSLATNTNLTGNARYQRIIIGGRTANCNGIPGYPGGAPIRQIQLIERTTGYFISQARNPGTAITQWGLFQCNANLNGGTLTFYISTGTSANQVTRATATWTAQTNNTVIAVATASFVAYRILFDIDVGTENPAGKDCTINWNEGTTRPPVSAEVYRDRYYLAFTSGTSGTVVNDNIIILDSRDQWTIHDAPNCHVLGLYNRNLYCGDSGANGRVYRMDIGQDDDGAAFSSRIRTKDFDLGNPWQRKLLDGVYLGLGGLPEPGFSINLTPKYRIDASTDEFSLDSVSLSEDYSETIPAEAPVPRGNNATGRYIGIALEHNGTQGPWKLFQYRLQFKRLRED